MSTADAALPNRPTGPEPERVAGRRLLWAGPLIVVAAIAANVVFALITVRIFGISPEFLALTPGAITMFTLFGVVGAVVVFAIVARFARRPFSLFRKIALVVLLLSLIPDLALLFLPDPAGAVEVILLMITHVIAAGIVVWLLERLVRA